MLGLGLALTKVMSILNGIIRKGLKMWLPFENSEILGENLTEGYDFDSGWTPIATIIDNANTFTTSADDGIYSNHYVENGVTYTVTIEGTTDAVGFQFKNASGSEVYYSNAATGAFSSTFTFVSTAGSIYLRNTSVGTTTITTLKIKEVTQIAPDKSSNSNNATLYTGKALSFDGVNDYVDFGSDINSSGTVWTTAIWIGDYTAGSYDWIYGDTTQQSIGLSYGSVQNTVFYRDLYTTFVEFSCDAFKSDFTDAKRLVFTSDGTDISLYIDGEFIDSITPTSTVLKLSRLMAGYDTTSYMVAATVSDFQLYDTAWTQADVTFDYNNPQHLVTDRAASTIALSNLKGYWHLSEGDGSIVYDSSGEGNDGTAYDGENDAIPGDHNNDGTNFGATWEDQQATIPQLGLMDWSKGSNLFDYSEDFSQWSKQSGTTATYNTTETLSPDGTNNATKLVSDGTTGIFNTWNSVSGVVSRFVYLKSVVGNVSVLLKDSSSVTTTASVTEQWQRFYLIGDKGTSTQGLFIDDIPATGIYIWGAQLEEGSSTTASAYRRTNGTAVTDATLIADPNDPSKDILGNSVRLREHSLNLDGSGYAEVPDADNLDFGTGDFSIEAWAKFKYENTDSVINVIIGLGGLYGSITSASLVTDSDQFKFHIGGTSVSSSSTLAVSQWYHIVGTRTGTTMRLYIDTEIEGGTSTTSSQTVTNSEVKYIGKDSSSDRPYQDLIDDVRIYNRALSSDEVAKNYKAGLNKHKTGSSFSDDFSSDYGF
jgi:hypothetical protein